jgi:putative ABC transport system ATP-binding protein
MSNNPLIAIKNLSKIYQVGEVEVKALDDVSLEINSGEITVILGPSGSGKTTLLNMIGGIDSPSKGEITVKGNALHAEDPRGLTNYRRQQIGFIFQFFNLIPNLTAQENIEFIYSYVMDDKPKGAGEIAKQLLDKVGLGHRHDHFPYQLSGGEQQRVAIARALAKNPTVMLADEPTGELDHKTGLKVLTALSELTKEERAVIIVTHDREIQSIGHRVINLRDGKVESIEDNKNPASISDLNW